MSGKKDVKNKPVKKSLGDVPEKNTEILTPEVIEKMPTEVKKILSSFSATSFRAGPFNPLHEKINAKHIDKIIQADIEDDEKRYKYATSQRWFNLVYIIISLLFFVFLLFYLLPKSEETFKNILTIILTAGGGFGIGVGYLSRKKSK